MADCSNGPCPPSVRVDANHGGKPPYFPNSYHSKLNSSMTKKRTPDFDPSVTEAPYQAANNVVSRMSYYKHEGERSEYDQVRELYLRVMSAQQRDNLHKNTAKLLKFADALVQKNYLIQVSLGANLGIIQPRIHRANPRCTLTQLYAIDPNYGKSIYDLLPEHDGYTIDEIAEASETAHLVGKDPSFYSPNKNDPSRNFMGMPYKATVGSK